MFAFLILLLPLSMLIIWQGQRDRAVTVTSAAGIICGILTCIYSGLFLHLHNIFTDSFVSNFSFLLLWEYAVPVLIWYAVYFLITKDTVQFKVKSMWLFFMGFFIVYLPFYVLFSCADAFSFYELFLKPLVLLSMLLVFRFCIDTAISLIVNKKNGIAVVLILAAAADFFIPAVFEALWITKSGIVLLMICMAVYILAGFAVSVVSKVLPFFKKSEAV